MSNKRIISIGVLTVLVVTSVIATTSNLAFSSSGDSSPKRGKVLERSKLHDEYTVFNLDKGAAGRVIGIAQGSSTDRYQLHVLMSLDDGPDHDLWIHYRPGLSDSRQAIQLLDAKGQPTQDVTQAASLETIRAGVSAWSDMEHNSQATQSLTSMWKKPSNPRKVASTHNSRSPRPATPTPAPVATSTQPIVGGAAWSVDCEDFIEPSGHYGQYGKDLLNVIGPEKTPDLFGGDIGDLSNVCPNYSQFSDSVKKNFWVWFSASVAMVESRCNPEVTAHGIHGRIAAGLWQLHLGHTALYCGGVCGQIDARNGDENARCGIRMLNWYTGVDQSNTDRNVYWEGSYWESLRAGGTLWKTDYLIHEFQSCFQISNDLQQQ